MKVKVENLGILKTAEFELGDLTIICGKNNTGKTYAVYALYGFLRMWRIFIRFDENLLKDYSVDLAETGTILIDLNLFYNQLQFYITKATEIYSNQLNEIFAATKSLFVNSVFSIEIDKSLISFQEKIKEVKRSKKRDMIVFSKDENSSILEITSLFKENETPLPTDAIHEYILEFLQDILIKPLFPNPFISSAERTGAAIFRKELDFSKNRLIEEIGSKKDLDPVELLSRVWESYALPVKDNVDFARELSNLDQLESIFLKGNNKILTDFSKIIGGSYKISKTKDEIYFKPEKKNIKLTLDESSSAIRSLLDLGFYINYIAQKGQIFMIDEPELNLHPENQRKIVRLFAKMVNSGIKVFITTHSDYIVKELNTLIMLGNKSEHTEELRKKYGYEDTELITKDQLKVYTAGKYPRMLEGNRRKTRVYTLEPANVHPFYGIEVPSFDESIDEMNKIQDEIVFGE